MNLISILSSSDIKKLFAVLFLITLICLWNLSNHPTVNLDTILMFNLGKKLCILYCNFQIFITTI